MWKNSFVQARVNFQSWKITEKNGIFLNVQICFAKFSVLKIGMDKNLCPSSICYYIWYFFLPKQSIAFT